MWVPSPLLRAPRPLARKPAVAAAVAGGAARGHRAAPHGARLPGRVAARRAQRDAGRACDVAGRQLDVLLLADTLWLGDQHAALLAACAALSRAFRWAMGERLLRDRPLRWEPDPREAGRGAVSAPPFSSHTSLFT